MKKLLLVSLFGVVFGGANALIRWLMRRLIASGGVAP